MPFRSDETYRTLIENLYEVVFTLDLQRKFIYISPMIEQVSGYQVEEVIGKSFDHFVHPDDLPGLRESFKHTLTGAREPAEFRILDKHGEIHYVHTSSRALMRNGEIVSVTGVLSDMTESKHSEDALRQAEEKYRNMVEWIPAAVYTDAVDEFSTTLFISPQIEKMTGYPPEEWISDPNFWLDIVHPKDRPAVKKENDRTNRTGDPFRMEYRILARDGREVWIRDESALLRDATGKPLCWQGVLLDISERKNAEQSRLEAEKELRESEERYRRMVELSPEAIAIHSEGRLVFANPAAMKLIGAQRIEDVIGMPIVNFVHADSRELVARRIKEALTRQIALPAAEEKFIRLDGSLIDVEVATMPFPYQGKDALQVLIRDVTERKQAEALQEAIYQIAIATETTKSLNDLYPRIHQIISSVMPAENFYITLYDETEKFLLFPYFKDAVDELYLGKLKPGKGLTAYVLRTGKSLLCTQEVHDELERQGAVELLGVPSAIWLGVPLIIEGKTIGAMVVQHYSDPKAYGEREQHMLEYVSSQVAIAITRKQAEEALSNSEASYRGLFNSVLEAIYIQDRDGRFLDVNDGAVKMYGYAREELIGKTPVDVSAPDKNDLKAVKKMVELAFQGEPQRFEFWGKRSNGEIFPKDVRVSKGKYFGQDIVIAVAQDITERKKAEEALQRQLKELTILQAVALAGTEAIQVDDLLERVTKIIVDTFSLDSFGVMLYDNREKLLRTHATYFGQRKEHAPDSIPLGQGVTGHVAKTGNPYRVGDVRKEKRYISVTPGMRSEVCIPIKTGDDLLGIINAESRFLNFFSAEDERLFVTIAGSLATAIQKLRLLEAERTRRQEAETLRQAVAVVSSSLELNDVLDAILASLSGVVAYDSASVILERESSGDLEIVAGRSLPEGYGIIGKCFPKTKKWQQLVDTHKPMILEDAQTDPRFEMWAGTEYIRGWMAVPLIVRDRVIGYISLDSRQTNTYTEEMAVLAQTFAYPAAIAVENARLYESEHRRRQEAETLRQVAQVVSASLDVSEVFRLMLEQLKHVLTFDTASVLLLGETGQPDLVTGMDYTDEKTTIQAAHELLKDSPILKQMEEDLKPLTIADVREHPGWIWVPGAEHVRSFLAVPIIARQKMIGALMADSVSIAFFTDDEVRVAQSLAQHMAIAIENARLFESEQRRRQEAETLREAVSAVASTLDPKQSIQLILEQLERVVAYDSASVQIYRDGYLEIVGGRGWPHPESVLQTRFPVPGKNPNSVVIQKRKPLILGNAPEQYPPFKEEPHKHIKSWLGVPLIAKNEVIGMLAVDSVHENHFNEESARLAVLFASQVASTLENTRLYEQALQAAERRAVLHHASQEIARTTLNPEQVYEAVHRAAERLMPAEAFVISLLDETNNEILAAYLYDKGGRWPATRSPANVGLSGEVIASGKAIIVRDLSSEPLSNSIHFGEHEEVRSILAVPMRLGDKIIGMLSAQSYQPHTYTEEDQSLLEMLSAHAAVAIENARLYNETHQRLTELEMVNRISTTLREAQTVSEMLPRLLDETLSVLQSDAGAIWLYDSSRHVLKEAISRGWFAGMNEWPIAPGEGIAGTVFQSGQAFISKEFAADPATRASVRDLIPAGWGGACVPIRTLQETIGVLFFAVQLPRQILPEEIHLLTTLSEIAGNAIRRADLYHQTQRQVQRLASLRAIDLAINTILDLRVTLGILIDHILSQLKVDAVDVLLLNPRTQTLYHGASSGFRTDAVNYWQVHISDDIAGKSVRTRNTIFIQNIRENTQSKRLFGLTNEHFESYFCVPLIAKGQVKGVMEIFHRSALDPDADWKGFLETLAGQAAIAIDNSVLFEDLQKSNVDLALAYDATIEGWSKALDLRDRETEGHTQRVTELTLQLAHIMGVSDPDQVHIRRGALLHDIGKMGVPDNILHKAGALTEKEWQVMHRHPVFAYEMLYPIAYLRPAVDIPYCHHERWNGKGYPRGLRGEEIPLAARLFAVVDVWDALISDRPYRKAWTKKAATKFIQDNSGILFDPAIAEAFLTMLKGEENLLKTDRAACQQPGLLYSPVHNIMRQVFQRLAFCALWNGG